MKAKLHALSIAFFSKLSADTLPVTIKTIEQNVGVNPKINRFVLPLCTTININRFAIFIIVNIALMLAGTEMKDEL